MVNQHFLQQILSHNFVVMYYFHFTVCSCHLFRLVQWPWDMDKSGKINKMAGYLQASFSSFFSSSFHYLIEFLELYFNNIICKTWSSDIWQNYLSFLTCLKLNTIICEWLTFIDTSGDRETEFVLWFCIFETALLGTFLHKVFLAFHWGHGDILWVPH
jgi:hypothetical protein